MKDYTLLPSKNNASLSTSLSWEIVITFVSEALFVRAK